MPDLEPSDAPGEMTDPSKPPDGVDTSAFKGSKAKRRFFKDVEYIVERRAFNRFREDPVDVTNTRTVETGETREVEQDGHDNVCGQTILDGC